MLATRVIPVVLYNGSQAVKTVRFCKPRNVGSVTQAARVYEQRQVDELVFLDIGARRRGEPDWKTVEAFAAELSCPFSVGGGIRSLDDATRLLGAGADKVVVGAGAGEDWVRLVGDIAEHFGSQAVIASVAVDRGFVWPARTEYYPVRQEKMQKAGAGEILLTDVWCEGTRAGFNASLISVVVRRLTIPLIANGGCYGPDDCVAAIQAGASAVAASSIFHFTEATPADCSKALRAAGIPVRL